MRNSLIAGMLLLATTVSHADPLPQAPVYPTLESEAVIGPVWHSPVRDQGDVGFCWAYAVSGLVEAEALKQGKRVTLSPEYLALNHLPNLLYQFLPIFDAADFDVKDLKGFMTRLLLDAILVEMVSPEGSVSFSESMSDAASIGMVPETFFNMKFPVGKDANGNRVEIHPTLKEKIQGFLATKLLSKQNVEFYEKNPATFRKDFFDSIGIHPPDPTATFVYQGQTYTPITFMRNYLRFNPEDYQEIAVTKDGTVSSIPDKLAKAGLDANGFQEANWPKPLAGLSQAQALAVAYKSIQDNRSVPIAMLVLEDQKLAEANGVFSNANCGETCSKSVGGHAILMTGMKQKVNGEMNGIIIKNSWGDIGLNDHGQISNVDGTRGFFIVTPDYLTSSETLAPNGWSILVNKKYITNLTN